MKKPITLKKLSAFNTKPSFTVAEASAKGVSGQSLAYYARKGVLERVAPGIYAFNGKDHLSPQWSDLIRIMQGQPKASICLITALDLYDLTDEIPREHWLAIPHEMRMPKIENCRFIRMRNMALGATAVNLSGVEVATFDIERTIVDTFRLLDQETAIKALKRATKKNLDINKVSSYAKKLRFNIAPYLLTVTT